MATTHSHQPFANAEHLHVLGATISITADSAATDGEYLVLDMLLPPRFENGLHTHAPSEMFHVIEGEMRLHVDGVDTTLGPGDSGYVPAGAAHGAANERDEVGRVIAIMSPGDLDEFFREAGEQATDRSLPEPMEPTPEALEALFAIGERYDMRFLGPLPDRAA